MADDNIDDFDYDTAPAWLTARGIDYGHLESLEEMIELIRHHLSTDSGGSQDEHTRGIQSSGLTQKKVVVNSQTMMTDILLRDCRMKTALSEVYQELLKFMHLPQMDEGIHDVMAKVYGDFTVTLSCYMSELVNDECPIVVAGETSAGKSSLLNLLLGTDVLPHSLLCATSTICRLHNSNRKMFEIDEGPGGVTHKIEVHDGETSDVLREKLHMFVSSVESRRDHKYKQVDIYWPIPMLQDRVTIVDTPGIGESDEITKRLMYYLPNAVAFIYVINSAIAGGVQDDRLLHILNKQREWEKEGKLCGFDRGCTIFVCNKWDQVEVEREETAVLADTLNKLRSVLPDLRDDQVFKMSTTKAARYLKSGMGHTEEFQTLLDGIQRLVPASLAGKVRHHYRWLEKFINKLQVTISSRINNAHATEDKKRQLQDAVLQRLNLLKMDSDRVRQTLIFDADEECMKIVDSLLAYLLRDDVRERLLTWRDTEAPSMGTSDMEVTKFNADRIITNRIQAEIMEWEGSSHLIKDLSQRLTHKFCTECALLGQTCAEIDLVIDNSGDKFHFGTDPQGKTPDKNFPIFSASEKAVLVVAAPLWLPLVTAASILFLPVGIGMLIKESIKEVQQKKNYSENKAKYMKKWTELFLKAVCTRKSIEQFIFSTYFSEFHRKIDKVCDDFIPNQIAADQKQVHMIANDRRQSREILRQFLPLQRGLQQVSSKMLFFGLQFMSEDLISLQNITKEKIIGKGTFSDVYLVTWQKGETSVKAALKELRRSLKGDDIYSQLSEVECQRKLKHENIVGFYGVAYSSHDENAQADGPTNSQGSDKPNAQDGDGQITQGGDQQNAKDCDKQNSQDVDRRIVQGGGQENAQDVVGRITQEGDQQNAQGGDGKNTKGSDQQNAESRDGENAQGRDGENAQDHDVGSMSQSSGGTLMLLLEFCSESLENLVFKNKHLQCRAYNSIPSRCAAFRFYVSMATGVCDGLAFIHDKHYLHRDLKLSNVLVKDGKAKICDLGFARMDSALTGTFVGTITHMAPEVFENKPYNWAIDIYSLGILLWELWYGRHAYSEDLYKGYTIPTLFDMIKSGERPMMDGQSGCYKYQPIDELKTLLRDCWTTNPGDRPAASQVGNRLKEMFHRHYGDLLYSRSSPTNNVVQM